MENLFISPDPANHALAWQLLKNQPRPLLENALQEWFEWAVKELAKFQKELYAAYRKVRAEYLKLGQSFTKKVKDAGFDWSGNIYKGVVLSIPDKVDWFLFTALQKQVDQLNGSIEKYNSIEKSSQFFRYDMAMGGWKDFNKKVYEAKLICGEITIAYQFVCLESDVSGSHTPHPSTDDFRFVFNQDAEHFKELGKKIKSVFVRHEYNQDLKIKWSSFDYQVNITGRAFVKRKLKPYLPQLF